MSYVGDGVLGTVGFSAAFGGLSAVATGGDFWRGAAVGATVGLLNHAQHETQTAQSKEQFQKTLAKFNALVKDVNSFSIAIDLAKHFTKQEIAWLKNAGVLTKVVGWSNVAVDGYLMIDAMWNGKPYEKYTYDTAIGIVSMLGVPGAVIATTVDSYVRGANFFLDLIDWVNTSLPKMIKYDIFRWY
jgi:hypothetical protein